jgi:hypothetical protein
MIRHPPRAVPKVSASEQASTAQVGSLNVSVSPAANSSAAITPTDFWASLAPWLNASAAELTHWPPLTGPRQRRVARRPARRRPRISSNAASPPRTGEIARLTSVPSTPSGCRPSKPPQSTAPVPPSNSAAPTSPPTSAWPELDGSPNRQVIRFQATAAASPAAVTSVNTDASTVTMPPIVSATAAPTTNGPSRLNTEASTIAWPGVAARVATRVAIEFDASWSPLVAANASARPTAAARPVSIRGPYRRRVLGPGV